MGAVAAFLALVAPAGADAAQRFVSPTGTGTACTSGAPCSITTGVNSAPAGSEVIIGPGTYSAGNLAVAAANISIHGESAASRPVINSTADPVALDVTALAPNTTISDLRINVTGATPATGLYVRQTATLNRVEVRTSATEACRISATTTMRDSICASSATDGTALAFITSSTAATLTLRNVNAIGTGSGSGGLEVTAGSQTTSVDARNVIARGDGIDIYGSSNKVTVTMQNSNFANVNRNGVATITAPTANANQSTAPIYSDANFHPAANSPTVDAGTTDAQTGTTDLEGKPRPQGSAIDIGAYELADTTPPDTTITAGPANGSSISDPTPEFSFTSTEPGSTFTCSVDGGSYAACTSPLTTPTLAVGAHTFSVRARDSAGNVDPSPASRAFTVAAPPDTTPPETTITKSPDKKTKSQTAKFTFQASEPATFKCSLDGKPLSGCTSPFSRKVGKGKHSFKVVATDVAGNSDASPATYSWTVSKPKKS